MRRLSVLSDRLPSVTHEARCANSVARSISSELTVGNAARSLSRRRRGYGAVGCPVMQHTIIDQPLVEMGTVNPRGYSRVVVIADQDREPETVQHSLDRAFPIAFVWPHLNKFADERQCVFHDPACPAQRFTQVKHAPRYVRSLLP